LEKKSVPNWISAPVVNGSKPTALAGFASATITGYHTRRYHGLLVAATKPPVGRFVLLSKLEETLIIGDRRVDLSTNRSPGVVNSLTPK